MPATSSGRIAKHQRSSKKTQHQKNHRWESFTTKIAKLHSLDPLRKVRRHDLEAEDLAATTSYLRNGIDRWAELNVSRAFLLFRRDATPLTDSLAQILHHESRLMDLLAENIARHDREALEPLLDLLTAFAHDLGVRFEKHYPRALALIVDLATKVHDVDTIEWTFASLAFLFKYLARLIVPDMRATYDAVAPLMGKARCPGHIARFAAEAMSFLVKKAAAPGQKDKALPLIVEHARKDLESMAGTKHFGLYSQGVMVMFAEAIKGAGNALHSTGPDIFVALARQVQEDEFDLKEKSVWTDVCLGVMTSIIHHATPETFHTVETRIVEEATAATGRSALFVQILGTMASVRRGGRIQEWPALIKAFVAQLGQLAASKEVVEGAVPAQVWNRIIINAALVWAQAPIDALIPSIGAFNARMTKEPLMKWYIPFCSYLSDLNSNRFRSLFQKEFQRFVIAHWSEPTNEDMLCVLLPRMIDSGALPGRTEKESYALPQSWQDQIVSKFVRLEDTPFPESGGFGKDAETWRDKCLPKYSARLRILELTAVHPSTNARIAEVLLKKLKLALRPMSTLPTDEANFIVSDGFRAYLRMCAAPGSVDPSLAPLLRAAAPRFCKSPAFLEALLIYQQAIGGKLASKTSIGAGSESPQELEDRMVKSLIGNLSAPSHELRLASLKILEVLDSTPDEQSALATMIQTENLQLNLQNVRAIGVHLRKLGQAYSHLKEGSWLAQAIPAFLFGMMTIQLTPVWDDAVEGMKKVAETKSGEEAIATLAFDWLEVPSPQWTGPFTPPTDEYRGALSDFECLNVIIQRKKAEGTGRALEEPSHDMLKVFEEGQKIVEPRSEKARSKALKAFSALPALAEKRSRQLVPHLLSFTEEADVPVEDEEVEENIWETAESSWALYDRKALVGVFAQFNNPRVLYQAQRVYSALLKLLANGDVEVQKLALKAILAWKQEGVKPYQEHLEFLLDETRFKNELTVLFQGDNKIQADHRDEIMPVLLRLLYGRTISKKGAASGRQGLHATRLAVVRHLDVDDMGGFLDIALGNLREVKVVDANGIHESTFSEEILPPRKLVGLLNMLESIINELGTGVLPYMQQLVNAVLYATFYACRKLGGVDEDAETAEPVADAAMYKVIKTTGLKCLCKLFQNGQTFDWTPYQDAMVKEIISPRIDKLPADTTQGVSGTWKLMETWSVLPKPAMFLAIDTRIVPKMIECIGVAKGKDDVKVFALEIIKNLIHLAEAPAEESEFNELIKSELLVANIDLILKEVSGLLRDQHEIGRELLGTAVDTVVRIAPIVSATNNVRDMVEIATFLLNQPSRKVSPKIKGSLLIILKQFIVLDNPQVDGALKKNVFNTVSSLFGYFKDRANRETLAEVLSVFAAQEPWAQEVADLSRDLNSFLPRRLDEPDYNKRLAAFNTIFKDRETPFTLDQWMPLLHNLLFFIQKDEEFGVLATNSADGLCKFIQAAQAAWGGPQQEAFVAILSDILLPAIYAGAREPSETVRREILRVFGHMATHLTHWEAVEDLAPLIPQPDEADKSFFLDILSPASLRQMQGLRVLEQVNEKHQLRSKHVSQFFIPLLEHYVFGRPESGDDHGVGAQAVSTIAALTASLEWQQYRAILRRFVSYIESKPDWQKRVVRLLEREVDALRAAIDQKAADKATDAMDVDGAKTKDWRLARTLPDEEKLSGEIINGFLPPLVKYMHDKDETAVSARTPVGIIMAKLLVLLPETELNARLPGMLTDICQILRSKSVESRDMARETLAKISGVLGAERFEFIIKELRGALRMGYQLHVLSFTLHSLLLVAIPAFAQGELDYCLPSIMAIILDDIFGAVGQEKDAEEYVSMMKEVKGSKSQDSMELVARNASIRHLSDLTKPLQALLQEKVDVRTARKIDDLLTRITKGLLENPAAASQDVLVFAYEVIQEVYKTDKPEAEKRLDPRLKRYLVQKGARKSDGGVTAKHTHKLVKFALDILRAVWKKHDNLRTPANIAGFLPILGDAVLSAEEEVKIAAFKVLNVLVKVPFKNDDASGLYKVATKEAIKCISMSTTTASDLAQAALKLISVVLRDRREIPIKEHPLDMLLGKLKDDLTEPLYRHVTFNFLRCVLDRKLETASVYDTLDYVGTVMITNDDKDTRDLARGAFFQFLRDYPQKRNRWEKQLKFIVANLKYEREGGRLSVMEVINLLLKKSSEDFAQEVAATCFIPLVFVLANDDSEKCRLAAGELIKEVFRVADKERVAKFLTMLRSWIEQEGNSAVITLALHAFGLYFEGKEPSTKDKKDLELVVAKINEVLGDEDNVDDWELINTALITTQTLVQKHPQRILSPDAKELWQDGVQECLKHPHATVKLTAVKTVSMFLADYAKKGTDQTTPLTGSHGLELTEDDIATLVRLTLRLFEDDDVDEALAHEAVQVLRFLGGYLDTDTPEDSADDEEADDDEEKTKQKPDARYLFWKLASIVRRERPPTVQSLVPKLAAMELMEAFCTTMRERPTLAASVRTMLRPLRNLTDPSIPAPYSLNETFRTRHDELKTKAQEVMDVLQRRLGNAEYTKALLHVGERVRDRRQQRSSKRKIEAITAPEKYGRDKRKKVEKKKEKRKEKGKGQRDARREFLRG